MKRFVAFMALAAAVVMAGFASVEAQDVKKPKIDPVKLKKLLKKLDPEIKAAQAALATAKAKLNAALKDEVLTEKGAVEGLVIDQLKQAIADLNKAIAHTNKAQKLDKGSD